MDAHGRLKELRDLMRAFDEKTRERTGGREEAVVSAKEVVKTLDTALEGTPDQWRENLDGHARAAGIGS